MIDLSRVLAGPYCGQLLADMGADVIKIESPIGDENRQWGPRGPDGVTCNFGSVNRGKRFIALNLKSDHAKEVLHPLVRRADVVIQSFLPATAAKLGVDSVALRRVNPALIHCSILGYGDAGPLRDKPGYDLMMQAFAGAMSITGEQDASPVRVGLSFIDMSTGLSAYSAITTALLARAAGSGGASVRTSLLETAVSLLGYHGVTWLQCGELPRKEGSGHGSIVPYQAFACADGYILAGATNDAAWLRLCKALGCNELASDPRFATNELRVLHRDVLVGLLQDRFVGNTVANWNARLEENGVAVSPVQTLDQVLSHPQVIANGSVVEATTQSGASTRLLGGPFRTSDGVGLPMRAARGVGADTYDVLRTDLGMDDADIDRLASTGIFS